jgi:hypothetical protein
MKLASLIISLPILLGLFAFISTNPITFNQKEVLGEIDSQLDVSKDIYMLNEKDFTTFVEMDNIDQSQFLDEKFLVKDFTGILLETSNNNGYIIEKREEDSTIFYIVQKL